MGEKHKMIGVIIMRMIKNLQNFLYDQDYFIDIFRIFLFRHKQEGIGIGL